jgi:hypothetical protein
MADERIPAYGHLAFDRQMTPDTLWRAALALQDMPDTSEALQEFAGTFAEIRNLPEVKESV